MKIFHLSGADKEIISILREDARKSYKEIAKKTGVAISTVHNTIKRLQDEGVIKNFSVKLESRKLGFDITVFIGIQVGQGFMGEVEAKLKDNSNVCQLFAVTGEYDLLLIAKFRDTAELDMFTRSFLQKIQGVQRTNTSLVLETLKERLNPTFEELIKKI
ncbi:MAG TPA: Lrp/AsnC family transcriptional regulator [Candidatus Nanoarchaeia archaeon]|nr:Lrp/AsnC family transcriptional regulator [Candidatus Nanoarchaeia archaeon]